MGTPRYKALLIGNATFERDPHNLPALKGPPEDLKLLGRALADADTGIHDSADVRTVLDGTNSEVREAIDDFFNSSAPDDQLLFYYSGHGRQDANNSLYLCTRDTRTDRLPSTAVGDVIINQMIATSHAARTVIVLDCCHSGSFKGGGMPDALAQASGRFLLTSCRNHQLATDALETGGASAFTTHLVAALTSGEVDSNRDGFVTLTEVYQHILPRLKAGTQQIPQLHLDKTVGDLPLARQPRRPAPPKPPQPPTRSPLPARPVLAVSDTKIDLHAVRLGEQLPPVVIDVFNEGDGELDWLATSDETWMRIEPAKRFFKLSFAPTRAGAHRGNVYVRDAGRGGSKRISVFVDVLEPVTKPELGVETKTLDFGTLRRGMRVTPQVIRLVNRGGGELAARAHATNPALRVSANDDAVSVEPDLTRPASLAGEVIIASAGGRAVVTVTGAVEEGPVLVIQPGKMLDFGTLPVGAWQTLLFRVENAGTGQLTWEGKADGNFFSVENDAAPGTAKVTAYGGQPGVQIGSIFIKSNGGDATINVRVEIVGPPPDPEGGGPPRLPHPGPPPIPPPGIDLSGWWQKANGRIHITRRDAAYQYADYNFFGVPIGGGTITVNGAQVFLQGTSLFIPCTGHLYINGPMMSGAIECLGMQNPVVYTRC